MMPRAALERLIEKWREEAGALRAANAGALHSLLGQQVYVLNRCADELAALLQETPGEAETPSQTVTEHYGPCGSCNGRGVVPSGGYSTAMESTCSRCGGFGQIVTSKTVIVTERVHPPSDAPPPTEERER